MFTRAETTEALVAFYKQVVRQPYLDESALKLPPSSGWDNIDLSKLRSLGKSDALIEYMRHLPYLESGRQYEKLLVENETVAIAYTQDFSTMMEEVNPLPVHCVYLTEGIDREGYSLILDIERGTITAYSTSGYEIPQDVQHKYDNTPRSEQWQLHRTMPAAELLRIWTKRYARLVSMLVPNLRRDPSSGIHHTRATSIRQSEQMALETGAFEQWQPDMKSLAGHLEDQQMRQRHESQWRHVANVYNAFLRHGWPDSFDKSSCRAEVLAMERQVADEERRYLDANNPDAALFDD